MAKTDAQIHRQARLQNPTVKSHLAYILLSGFALMVMYTLLRIGLLVYNREMIGDTPASTFLEALFNGTRFDLRLTVYLLIPLVLSLFSARAMAARGFFRFWLTLVGSITLFFGLMEMDFYREFHQRLNGLVFQYVKEDPKTVLSMLWYGFPVVRYLLAWAVVTWLLSLVFKGIDRATRPRVAAKPARRPLALLRLGMCAPVCSCWCCWSWWSASVALCVKARRCAGATLTPLTPTSPTSWASTAH